MTALLKTKTSKNIAVGVFFAAAAIVFILVSLHHTSSPPPVVLDTIPHHFQSHKSETPPELTLDNQKAQIVPDNGNNTPHLTEEQVQHEQFLKRSKEIQDKATEQAQELYKKTKNNPQEMLHQIGMGFM